MGRSNLFQSGSFTLRSGKKSKWKLELDALTPDDWMTLALIASEFLAPFGEVEGVPRGGLPFAEALKDYRTCLCGHIYLAHFSSPPYESNCYGEATPCSCEVFRPMNTLLIVEDVCTTGGSAERHRNDRDAIGVCVFARGETPSWITPIFKMTMKETRR